MTIREMLENHFFNKGFEEHMTEHVIEQTKVDFEYKINRYPFTIDTSEFDIIYWDEVMELYMLIGITIQKLHYSVFI